MEIWSLLWNKTEFCQIVVVSELMHSCTTWNLMKYLQKMIDRLKLSKDAVCCFELILNLACTKQQQYSYLTPIPQTIHRTLTSYVGHYFRSREKLMSHILLWIATYGHINVAWPAKPNIIQFFVDNGFCRVWWPIGTNCERESQKNIS